MKLTLKQLKCVINEALAATGSKSQRLRDLVDLTAKNPTNGMHSLIALMRSMGAPTSLLNNVRQLVLARKWAMLDALVNDFEASMSSGVSGVRRIDLA